MAFITTDWMMLSWPKSSAVKFNHRSWHALAWSSDVLYNATHLDEAGAMKLIRRPWLIKLNVICKRLSTIWPLIVKCSVILFCRNYWPKKWFQCTMMAFLMCMSVFNEADVKLIFIILTCNETMRRHEINLTRIKSNNIRDIFCRYHHRNRFLIVRNESHNQCSCDACLFYYLFYYLFFGRRGSNVTKWRTFESTQFESNHDYSSGGN